MTNIILGPPGTGKTTSLLSLIEKSLARGTPPDRIALVTFTTRGANEARERAMKKFGLSAKQLPHFSTLHSLCYRQLGLHSSDVLTGKTFFEFADYARIRVTGRSWSDDGLLTGFEAGDRILFMENLSRIRQITLRQQYDMDDDGIDWREVERVARALEVFKRARGLMDFTDMLSEFVKMDHGVPLQELYVDESQDLSSLQWSVVELLSRGTEQVTIAGDDDQAIYSWAGADVQHLISMEGDARVLGQSFRVPIIIQKIANEIIDPVKNRRQKRWKPRRGELGEVERANTFDGVDCGDGAVLVLARNQYVIKEQIEPALRREGIVYENNGRSSIDMKLLRAAVTWEDLKVDKPITLGEVREMYEYMSSGVGVRRGYKRLPKYGDDPDIAVSMRDLMETGGLLISPNVVWHEALDKMPRDDMSYMLAARRRGEKLRGAKPRVRLSTIHSAKGAEADHVVIMREMAKRTWYEMTHAVDDERRVWYVGVTRAKRRLTIVNSETNRECPWL